MLIDQAASAEHFASAIHNSEICSLPASYIFFENALPLSLYREIDTAYAASADVFREQIHKGDPKVFFGSYTDRLEMKVPEDSGCLPSPVSAFWLSLKSLLGHPAIFAALYRKFAEPFCARFGPDRDPVARFSAFRPTLLVTRHGPNYYLGPHTDRFEKVITCILNLSEHTGLDHLGTAMYQPKAPEFTCRARFTITLKTSPCSIPFHFGLIRP